MFGFHIFSGYFDDGVGHVCVWFLFCACNINVLAEVKNIPNLRGFGNCIILVKK